MIWMERYWIGNGRWMHVWHDSANVHGRSRKECLWKRDLFWGDNVEADAIIEKIPELIGTISRRFVHILPHNGYYALAFVSPKMI
ncbi:hypothetical protein [Brevibacillus fortis]|uniref:hypothetical protein n=1 Tax=Brevibacillus fortis TaxID=2126352 RepID=UPI0038FCF507